LSSAEGAGREALDTYAAVIALLREVHDRDRLPLAMAEAADLSMSVGLSRQARTMWMEAVDEVAACASGGA
jgi:hypothetical protein